MLMCTYCREGKRNELYLTYFISIHLKREAMNNSLIKLCFQQCLYPFLLVFGFASYVCNKICSDFGYVGRIVVVNMAIPP